LAGLILGNRPFAAVNGGFKFDGQKVSLSSLGQWRQGVFQTKLALLFLHKKGRGFGVNVASSGSRLSQQQYSLFSFVSQTLGVAAQTNPSSFNFSVSSLGVGFSGGCVV